MTLSWNRDYSLNEDKFSVGTLRGRIKADYAKSAMEQYFDKTVFRFGVAKVVYKHGKFFLHISVSCDVNELQASDVCNVVGHDRGIRFITASYGSNGKTTFYGGNTVKQKRAHYKSLRKQLQQVGTPSSRRRLKSIGQRENRWMSDINHQISKALVESNPFCCKNCGYSSNDDRIGAMNLYRMGIEYLVESQVSTSDLRGQ